MQFVLLNTQATNMVGIMLKLAVGHEAVPAVCSGATTFSASFS